MTTRKAERLEFSLAHFCYSIVLIFALPIALFRLRLRGVKLPAYRERWRERFGMFKTPQFNKPVVWLHTVSVGEFITAKPIINHLLERGDHEIVVTTTTPTASEQVTKNYQGKVFHVYSPYDLHLFISWFLNKIKPRLTVILETELWPNTVDCCYERNIPVVIVNARLSEKSAAGYKKVAWLFLPMIRQITHVAVQNQKDAQRFQALGLTEDKTLVTGSIKFDVKITGEMTARAKQLKSKFSFDGQRKILLAASTHKGEDKIVLDAFVEIRKQHPDTLLLLAPRHPDRFEDVYELCRNRKFKLARRSNDSSPQASDDILLCDTMGELFFLYGAADIAIVCGSFVGNGGHNYIEAAAWGIPVISGPSTFNFAQISELLLKSGGMVIANDSDDLATKICELFSDEQARNTRGEAALNVTLKNRGATLKTTQLIDNYLPRQ